MVREVVEEEGEEVELVEEELVGEVEVEVDEVAGVVLEVILVRLLVRERGW